MFSVVSVTTGEETYARGYDFATTVAFGMIKRAFDEVEIRGANKHSKINARVFVNQRDEIMAEREINGEIESEVLGKFKY